MTNMGLDFQCIEASLISMQEELKVANTLLDAHRDPLDRRVIENMLAGYAYIERLANQGLEPFARVEHVLELNRLALCGIDPERRQEFRSHLDATERRFYDEANAGIEDVVEWMRLHKGRSIWERAAAAHIRILAKPQLFIEGNHRTAALVMSWILMRGGKPPFVLSTSNAVSYFKPSASIRDIRKSSVLGMLRLPRIQRRFADFLQQDSNPRYWSDQVGADAVKASAGSTRRPASDSPLAAASGVEQ
ncbi:MAG: Fic family protein [Burkholderiales bacterium]